MYDEKLIEDDIKTYKQFISLPISKKRKGMYILMFLKDGMTYSDVEYLTRIKQPNVFVMLKGLREAGLITTAKKGRESAITLTRRGRNAQTGMRLVMEAVTEV